MIPLALKALGFLKGLPWQLYAALAAVALCWGAWHAHTSAVAHAHAAGLREGAEATAKLFARRQAEADALARAHVAKTVTRQEAIATEKSHAFDEATASIDARARALKLQHDTAVRRAPSRVDLPAAGEAASQPCPAPAEDGLAWDVALVALTHAAKMDEQVNKIIDFEEAQDALVASEAPTR